jgi:hypothetical protein
MPQNRIILEFPDKASSDSFLNWWCDGGGEQQFFGVDEEYAGREDRKPIGRFDYSLAYPAWGYKPKKHGQDRIVKAEFAADEE